MNAPVVIREIKSRLGSIMVLAAALSVQDPRARPLYMQAAAYDWKETGFGQ